MSQDWVKKIGNIKEYIDSHICEVSNISEISEKFDIHVNQLFSWFKVAFKISPNEYILNRKIKKLINMLHEEGGGHIAYYYAQRLGYESESALCHLIKRRVNLTFSEFMKKVLDD